MGISLGEPSSRLDHICLNLPETLFSVPNRLCFTALTKTWGADVSGRKEPSAVVDANKDARYTRSSGLAHARMSRTNRPSFDHPWLVS